MDAVGPVGGHFVGGIPGASIGEAISGSKVGGFFGALIGEGLEYIIIGCMATGYSTYLYQ